MLQSLIFMLVKQLAAEAPEMLTVVIRFVEDEIVKLQNKAAALPDTAAALPVTPAAGTAVAVKVLPPPVPTIAAPVASAQVAAAMEAVGQEMVQERVGLPVNPANIPRDTAGME